MFAPSSASSTSSSIYNGLDAQLPPYALHRSQLTQPQYSTQPAHAFTHPLTHPLMEQLSSPAFNASLQCPPAVEELRLPPCSAFLPPFPQHHQTPFSPVYDGSHAPFAYQQPPITTALRALQLDPPPASLSASLRLSQADAAQDCGYDSAALGSALLFDGSSAVPAATVCSVDSLESVLQPETRLPMSSSTSPASFSSSSRSPTPSPCNSLSVSSRTQQMESRSQGAAASTAASFASPSSLSRRPAVSQGDRRLKHRQIDAARRRREMVLLDRFAALSGQREERQHRDRVTTLEVACDRYDALVRNTAAMRRRMQRMERMLGGAEAVGWEEGEMEEPAVCSGRSGQGGRGVRGRRAEAEEEGRESRRRRLEDCEALLRELQGLFSRASCRAFTSSSTVAASTIALCSVCLRTARNREANLSLFSHSGWQRQDVIGKVCGPIWNILSRHRLLGSLHCEESLRDRPPVRSRDATGGEGVLLPLRAAAQREEVELGVLSVLRGEKDRVDVRWRTGLADGRSVELMTALWLVWTGGTDLKGESRDGGGAGRRWQGGRLEDAELVLAMQPASMTEYVEESPHMSMASASSLTG